MDGGGGDSGAGDSGGGGGSPEASAATTEIKHPSRKERAKKANNAARRKASILGGFQVGGARPKVQPIDSSSVDASAAALPESQGKGGLSLGGGYEDVVGDNVSLVRAHARSTAAAAEQADEQSGQVGKSMKSAKL